MWSHAAFGINNFGQIVGASYISGIEPQAHHAVLWIWENNALQSLQDLGGLGGDATDSEALWIKDSGQIVGGSCIAGDVEWHAFLWESGAGMQALGTLGGGIRAMLFR